MIDFEEYRREDRTIDLKKLFGAAHLQGELSMREWGIVSNYFKGIEITQPINSRQVAAMAIEHARQLVRENRTESRRVGLQHD